MTEPKRYRIWHDGTGMKNPFKGYFAGYSDSVKDARHLFSMHRKSYPNGEMRIDLLNHQGELIRKTKIKPLNHKP